MSAIISRALSLNTSASYQFKDTKGNWSDMYIKRLVHIGVLKGYSNGTFKPDEFVTVKQLFNVLDRVSKYITNSNLNYEDYFKNLKPSSSIEREDAVNIMNKVFIDLNIISN